MQRKDTQIDRLLVLDTSPFPDELELSKQNIVLRWRDANAEFSRPLTAEIQQCCDAMGITYRFKDEYIAEQNKLREKPSSLGRTELGRLISAVPEFTTGTTVQLPTTGYHTQMETANLVAGEAMLDLLERLSC